MSKKRNPKSNKNKATVENLEEKFEKKESDLKKASQKKAERIIDIFKATNSEDIDMTKLDQKTSGKKNKIIIAVIIFLFILAASAFLGFLFFNNNTSSTRESQAKLTIQSVDEMSSGDQIDLEITYENKESTAIANGTITIHYPAGFYFKKAEPQPNESDNTWQIENVSPGTAGKIKISGQLVGELNENKEFTGLLTYKPVNFNSEFQDTTNKIVKINDTIITMDTHIPETIFSGQVIDYNVKFKNTSSLPLANVKIVINYPDGFSANSSEPNADINNNIWKYSELKAQEEKTVKVKGVLVGNSKEKKEFKFQLGLEEPDGVFNIQVEKNNSVLVVNPNINLTLTASPNIKPGEEIEYKINAENTSDIEIKNLEFKLDFTDGFFDANSVLLEKIDSLNIGEKKDLSYKAKLKDEISPENNKLKAVLSVNNAKIEGEKFNFTQQATAESIIKAEFKFSAEARYYDNDLTKIGTGPIPPQVGETTSYVIWWDINAINGNLKNIEATTTVPEIVDGVDSSDSSLVYDRSNKQIKWTIPNLTTDKTAHVSFTVYVTPTKDQLNKLLILNKEIIINAIDDSTNENISQNIDKLTSDLPNDPAASGKGVVEQKQP